MLDVAEAVPDDGGFGRGAVAALRQGRYRPFARQRRDLIASSPDLQERELIKMASLTAAVAQALRHRGAEPLQASLTAQAGVGVFTTAYDQWVDDDSASDLSHLVRRSLHELRRAICARSSGPAGPGPVDVIDGRRRQGHRHA